MILQLIGIFNMNEIINVLGHIAGLGGLIGICMLPAVWFIVGPHFKKVLKVKYDPLDAMYDFFPKLGRAEGYTFMIVFGNGMKRSLSRMVYGDHDFRKDVRLIDKIIAYMMWVPFITGLIAAGLAMICWLILKIQMLL